MTPGDVVLGRYRVLRAIARGGMGEVFLARAEGAEGFARPVVIKRILPGHGGDAEKMFAREAKILAQLDHDGIVRVIDFEREGDGLVMVLEYVHGRTLTDWIRCQQILRVHVDWVVALQIVIEVLEALHYAHTLRGPDGTALAIVHRDVSPSNVLVATDGRVKLVDFGVARALGDDSSYVTKDLAFKGKLAYTAPEIFEHADPSAGTDVYSAAVVLHELLLGRNELRKADDVKTLAAVISLDPSRPSSVRDDTPEELDFVLKRALSKLPERRFQSAGALADALRGLRGVPEEEARARVKEAAETIFVAIEERLGRVPLDELEHAWRAGAIDPKEVSTLPPPPEGQRTISVPLEALAGPDAPPAASSRPWLAVAAVAVVLVAIVAGAVAWVIASDPDEAAPVIVVQSTGGAADPVVEDAAPAEAPPAEPAPEDDSFEGRFRRRSAEIDDCFDAHAEEGEGITELEVVLRIGRDGAVRRAGLAPASLEGTELGRCLIEVARGTEFAPQSSAVRVRIPLARR